MRKLLTSACAAFALLAGCSGGGGTTPSAGQAPTATGPVPAGTTQSVRVSVVIGGKTTGQSNGRRPKFVSPSTAGIDIKAYAHGGNTIIGEAATDISSGSAACGGQTGTPRTCTVSVPAPPGNDDFVATSYDAAPVGGGFAGAHVLGTGAVTATIAPGASNSLILYLSGVITTLGYLAPNASLPADGSAHTLGFVLNPSDYGNNPITAGNNDPYANPVTVQLSESGGSGHAQILKNGTPAGTSATLNHSTDTVAVQYDGGGAPGYDVTVTVSASGVTPETLTLSPLYVTSASPYHSGTTLSFTASGQTAQVNFSETGAPPATTYHATPSASCAGIATASAPSGTGSAASTTVTAGNNGGSCSIAFSDGSSTITWSIVVSTGSATVTIPSGAIGPIVFNNYSNGAIQGQTDPASGKPWLSNSCGGNDYDAHVVPTSSYPSANWTGFTQPTKALQFSNPVTQGCYSGLGTPEGPKTSGYPNSLTDTSGPVQCGPTCNPYFSFQFTATSATGGFQPDLEVNFSPVFANNGARMAWVGLWHTTDHSSNNKLLIFTNDVEGIVGGPAPCFQCANFVAHEVAYVDPTVPHKIGLAINFVQPGNDAVTIYVDGVQQPPATTIRSWEDYYLFDTESDPGYTMPYSRAVDDVLFRAGNVDTCVDFNDYSSGPCSAASPRAGHPGHTANSGNGFLITDITTCSGTAASCAAAIQTSSFARSPQSRSSSFFGSAKPTFRTRAQLR